MPIPVRRRPGRLASRSLLTALLVSSALLAVAAPALAASTPPPVPDQSGSVPAPPLSVLQFVAIYVAIPVGILVVVSALVLLPGARRSPRYRPTRGWEYGALWFAGPEDDAATAVSQAKPVAGSSGGAHGSW